MIILPHSSPLHVYEIIYALYCYINLFCPAPIYVSFTGKSLLKMILKLVPTTYVILRAIYVILRVKIDLNASFRILNICSEEQQNLFMLIIYRGKAVFTKCRRKRTMFKKKCELLKYYSYRKHLDQIRYNTR